MMHLNHVTEPYKSTRFFFRGQKQSLRICFPFTEPNNDKYVPSNSNEISGNAPLILKHRGMENLKI